MCVTSAQRPSPSHGVTHDQHMMGRVTLSRCLTTMTILPHGARRWIMSGRRLRFAPVSVPSHTGIAQQFLHKLCFQLTSCLALPTSVYVQIQITVSPLRRSCATFLARSKHGGQEMITAMQDEWVILLPTLRLRRVQVSSKHTNKNMT